MSIAKFLRAPANVLLMLCSTTFLVNCGESGQNKNKFDSKANIVGGKVVDNSVSDARRLSTVALTTDHSSSTRRSGKPLLDSGRSFCTGTIVAPRVLMTAAHCIQEFNPQTNVKTSDFILPGVGDFISYFGTRVSMDGKWLRAASVIPHPDWDPSLTLQGDADRPPNDIGLVILESDIPGEYKPVGIADPEMTLKENQTVTLVGFGVTRTRRNNNTGVLREVSLPLKSINKRSQILGVGNFMKGACAGDSGGPMYTQDENGNWLVIGVTSAGVEIFQNCIGVDNTYTDARSYKGWVSKTLGELGLKLMN